MPFDRFLNAVYAFMVQDATQESIDKFDAMLFMPPLGVSREAMRTAPGWSQEEQGASFMAMMAQRGTRAT